MSLNEETSGEAFFPVPIPEARTEGFRQEEEDQNEDLLPELMQFLQGTEIPWVEIDITSTEFAPVPPEKESTDAKIDDGLLTLDEIDQNELFPELNQFNEPDPTPGPSSGENQDSNLMENIDREMKDIQEGEEGRKSSAPSKTGSNHSKKRDYSGKCCECNNVYLDIFKHNQKKHNGELEKCTATDRVCKEYFASAQKRIEHEQQQEHQERKRLCCQLCHYSTDHKGNLNTHVRYMHSKRKIKCGHQKCGKMFASDADLNKHVKMCHKEEKCPKCGREMSLAAFKMHKWRGRCPGTVVAE